MRVAEMVEYVVGVVVFACCVLVLFALGVDAVAGPGRLTTATAVVMPPSEAAKRAYIAELRLRGDDDSRLAVATMEAKMRVGL